MCLAKSSHPATPFRGGVFNPPVVKPREKCKGDQAGEKRKRSGDDPRKGDEIAQGDCARHCGTGVDNTDLTDFA